jgi:hypothetical protein
MKCHCFDSGMGRRRVVMSHKSGDLPHCKAHNKLTRMRGCMFIRQVIFAGVFVVKFAKHLSCKKRGAFIVGPVWVVSLGFKSRMAKVTAGRVVNNVKIHYRCDEENPLLILAKNDSMILSYDWFFS